ncbi:MAG TPA: ATP-binding protein [Thermoanaerobaculia bacterium]|nr:ATP-binding protein [Thermoanaerobaculia bacterium]HUM29650.1 ATP-binding protein [Thermoanaerobaculia bacterium]HXK67301.1 ATP-binding protein [Thermoanaerobaculia bacterium]
MIRNTLFSRLFITLFLFALLPLLAVTVLVLDTMGDLYLQREAEELRAQTILLEPSILQAYIQGDYQKIDAMCKGVVHGLPVRFTVILAEGTVIGDSDSTPGAMDNHALRPEIVDAFKTGSGRAERYSYTLNTPMLYVARAVKLEEHVPFVIRAARPMPAVRQLLSALYSRLLGALAVMLILSILASAYIAWRINRPLVRLRDGALAYTRGLTPRPIHPEGTREIRALTEVFNDVASRLHQTLQTVQAQSEERKIILSSMQEGVLAFDAEGKVLDMNEAAFRILSPPILDVRGRWIEEVVRHPDLLLLIHTLLDKKENRVQDIITPGSEERHIHARGTLLRSGDHVCKGGLIVLLDVTEFRRFEKMRSEFVANVSHELKTPLTTMTGAIETLQSMEELPGESSRFLDMLSRQADRLRELIEDLLGLAALERMESGIPPERTKTSSREILERVQNTMAERAGNQGISVEIAGLEFPVIDVNPTLMEQALTNLVDNAIHASPQGTTITLSTRTESEGVAIDVTDEGCGIPPEHLERIFERFYRVPGAKRSGMQGSGLGLAIVKHTAHLFGGRVEVSSTPGKGSRFSIILPRI